VRRAEGAQASRLEGARTSGSSDMGYSGPGQRHPFMVSRKRVGPYPIQRKTRSRFEEDVMAPNIKAIDLQLIS